MICLSSRYQSAKSVLTTDCVCITARGSRDLSKSITASLTPKTDVRLVRKEVKGGDNKRHKGSEDFDR